MNTQEIREHQIEFEKIRKEVNSEFKEIDKKREKFTKDYPVQRIQQLELDDYVIGKGKKSFCYRIEKTLNLWGNIHGGTAKKFGIYYGTFGDDKTEKYRIGKTIFGNSIETAFEEVKSRIIELLNNQNDIKILRENPISPMFKGKILSVYFPDKFLNIFAASHLNYFINVFSLENNSKSELDKQNVLLEFKNKDSVMKDWSIYEFSKFLYTSFGKPNSELKDSSVPQDLMKYKLPDFPPSEQINAKFISPRTLEMPNTSRKVEQTQKGQTYDHIALSKKYKRIGDRGEQIVIKKEREVLRKANREDLALKINHVSKKDDSAGYDILSYDITGQEKLIEVKSTLKPAEQGNIFISKNELEVAKSNNNYYFYLVFDAGSTNPKIWKVGGSDFLNDKKIIIEPVNYKITFTISN